MVIETGWGMTEGVGGAIEEGNGENWDTCN